MIQKEHSRIYADFLSILRRSTDLLTEDPIREEIFSVERLELYACYLAKELKITANPKRGRTLVPELKESGRLLLAAYRALADVIGSKQAVSPAAEWFVDNFHIIEDQLREIQQDLPEDYYSELPKLAEGELKGFPRVYALALAIIAHTDSRLDAETLKRFIQSYQQISPLRIGELWAVPITLRIALVEHLKPLALRIVSARHNRERADALADQLLEIAARPQTQPHELVQLLATELDRPERFDRAFVVQLIQRLRDQDPDVWPAFDWLEKKLKTLNTNTQKVTQLEHYRQATAQVTVGNIIASMRLLSSLDWRDFFESVSLVEPILAQDPMGAYSGMDFASRDQYRHVVERVAKRTGQDESRVAGRAVELAAARFGEGSGDQRDAHVGYYLVGEGLPEFEAFFSYRPRLKERVFRGILRYPTSVYLGSLALLSAAPLVLLRGYSVGIAFYFLAAFLSCEFALSLLNHYVTFFIRPKTLLKMDTTRGLPIDAGTMVVIPTLFTKESVVQGLLEGLQIHFLANQDPAISFALLGDYGDADVETRDGDISLLEAARQGIDELNERYCQQGEKRFHLFHRRRQWNSSEGKWIGWERKRGKLLEFNRLLRGATDTSYVVSTASPAFLARIKYVITLDSDTQLPRDAALKLVGTILHPLNRPLYDPVAMRVTSGYGILQPRISVSLASAGRTQFARIYSGNTGLDPYTTAVSDVYQDLFGEGSFTGKGLYVVDAFELALADRVPENAVLSHDLFEGSYARSALVTDVELIDDYPSDYETFAKRQHRWTRGDWQIAPWLFPWVPDSRNRSVRNRLPLISRWKIFDNLRRSLVAPATLLWLVLAWTVLPGSPVLWTLPILLIFTFPVYAPFLTGVFLNRRGLPWAAHLRGGWAETELKFEQIFLMIAFLAAQAWNQVDAICRTLFRKLVSKQKLLEWVTFAQTEQLAKKSTSILEKVGSGPCLAFVLGLLLWDARPESLGIASPFLMIWLANPWIKRWLKVKVRVRETPLGPEQIRTFRHYARRTWHFFETFVLAEDHWLAPDNFQEDPKPVVAHRTSPTNIGLQLLATVSAYDFGYIGLLELTERLENTFLTLGKLPGLRGHFFNWYDTTTLEPLRPQYISTVDSGNLAGHLLTLKQACLGLARRPLVHPQARAGLADTLYLLKEEMERVEIVPRSSGAVTVLHLQEVVAAALRLVEGGSEDTVEDWDNFLKDLSLLLVDAEDILNALDAEKSSTGFFETRIWLEAALHQTREFRRDLKQLRASKEVRSVITPLVSDIPDLLTRHATLAARCDEIALGMDFKFLFDEQRKIFVIGYNVADGRRDQSYYDLLASESRLASFVAIAKGDVPQEHWFRLGRRMTSVQGGGRALIAWTATMFEYLMPLLVMRRFSGTLLNQTYHSVVARQIGYGKERGVPWGISEAGYNARDLQLNYQYGPFGIPGLGLKRGLSDDLVISPYSTMLAAMIDPWAALENLKTLENVGALARFGFYESIDYTPERLQKKQKSFILRSFMAHHQGMSLVAIDNLLNDSVMQRRFHAEPLVQATQLLLQERIPQAVALSKPRAEEVHAEGGHRFAVNSNPRFYSDVHNSTPRTQLLSNGKYSVMVTSAGSGYSRCGKLAMNRWREDATRDPWGHFSYIRNRTTGKIWSSAYQPTATEPRSYDVTFGEDKVEFWRQDETTTTHTEIIVSPEDNVELRRVSLTNGSDEVCEFEVTSFMETVLAPPADDAAHPAFSNLFVQTEFVPNESALLATRRKRSKSENQVWGFHVLVTEGQAVGAVEYETDRARFLGRGRTAAEAVVIREDRPLSNTVGSVLDPIFSLRQSVRVGPGETVRVTFATGLAGSREDALRLADKYHDIHIFAREAELAWTQAQVQLRHLNIGSDKAHLYQRLAGRILYSDSSLRPRSHQLALNTKTQSGLWAYGISGDVPIILTRISDEKDMAMVRELLHAHEYLRLKGLVIDLVILNERPLSYQQSLQDELQKQIRMSGSRTLLDKPGGVFIRRADIMPAEDLILLKTVARVILSAEKGTLDEQLKRRAIQNELPPALVPVSSARRYPKMSLSIPDLSFFNGLGGFSDQGQYYVTILNEGQWTPAPWINVVANSEDFGFTVSESGAGYTWSVNSRENRLTSWSNDAVSDPVSEAIYIRDEETGEFWTPTPLPIRESETYQVKHAAGFSQFEHTSHGISQGLQLYVPMDASVKISRLRLKNLGGETRRLSVTSFAEWVLGFQRGVSAPTVITEHDLETGAIFARNPYNQEFAQRVAFADMSEGERSFTCDRQEFLGRNGSPARPVALGRESLSGAHGAGLDPCAAFQTIFELAPGEEREVIILLGEAESVAEARRITTRYRERAAAQLALEQVVAYWEETLGVIEVKTPDLALNTLVNRWLLYQTLSCRIWARSAFYQSGGAFGFRDQLQDVMALVYSQPLIARAQILKAAARQFKEGDVQHWWHPPTGRGVRTRFSDDLLWLPYVVSFYVGVTGDRTVLEERTPFIEAPELEVGQDDAYTHPRISNETATVLEHCARALDRSLKTGAHGLPLMGSGDWNDGMSRVGHEGKGESVWVGWFLYKTLKEFIPFCTAAGEQIRATAYAHHLTVLKTAIEDNAWDGEWYKRAYFDDGTALGSATNQECRIDSIAQSWAVLSGAGDPQRAVRAMAAVDEHLIHRGDGLIQLFAPPFDKSEMDPGYIKGYLPGVRENGGQYTHAAIWTMMAFAAQGDGDRAGELFALLNPINRASSRAGLHRYKVEPYVMAADIYGLSPHVGRGGWTWYTGSASWMYRAALESMLGFELRGDRLRIKPCIPKNWPGFEMTYRRGATHYEIRVTNRDITVSGDPPSVELDGTILSSSEIPLVDDGGKHKVHVRI